MNRHCCWRINRLAIWTPKHRTACLKPLIGLVRDTGLGAVIATHNLDLAARMDRQLRLDAGVLVAL